MPVMRFVGTSDNSLGEGELHFSDKAWEYPAGGRHFFRRSHLEIALIAVRRLALGRAWKQSRLLSGQWRPAFRRAGGLHQAHQQRLEQCLRQFDLVTVLTQRFGNLTVGDHLRRKRLAGKMLQREVAEQIGVDTTCVCN
jgi:hypothetical protein